MFIIDKIKTILADFKSFDFFLDAINVIDKEHTLIFVNKTHRKIYGDNYIGKKCIDYYHLQPKFYVESTINKSISTKRECFTTLRIESGDWYEVNVVPIIDINDEVIGAITIYKDISPYKSIAEQLLKRNYELVIEREELLKTTENEIETRTRDLEIVQNKLLQSERLALIGQITAGVAHEINNPITAISGFVQTILKHFNKGKIIETKDIEEIKEFLKIIKEETNRCSKIVSTLLELSKVKKFPKFEVDLNKIVSKTVKILEQGVGLKNRKIILQLCEESAVVVGNEDRLQQLCLNILKNALEHIGIEGEVVVKSFKDKDVFLEFSDNGVGIPEKNIDKIFEPFFSTKEGDKGTGLGLAIAHKIVEDHGAKIEVKSEKEKGTTFLIRFPWT